MKKTILLLVSGILILSLAGSAMASSTVLVPDDSISVAPGQTGTVKVTVQQLTENENYKVQVSVLRGSGIKASLQGNAVLDIPANPLDMTTWANTSNVIDKPFTYTSPQNVDLKIYREPGMMDLGKVKVAILDEFGGTVAWTEISSESVDVTVPEFPSVALPIAAILGLVFIFGRKKEEL